MDTPSDLLILKAAAAGNLQLLKQLADGDVLGFLEKCNRVKDCEGLTALHHAAAAGNIQICNYLIQNVKVNINVKTKKGDTPLFLAIKGRHLPTATYLTQHGANANESDFKGMTPLHYASEKGDKRFMQLLISQGADVEAIYEYGTPLQAASHLGKIEAVRMLLDHNANAGCTPLEHAALACNLAGIELLFPLTSRIPSILDWTIAGIIDYVHSKKGKEQGELKRKENFQLLKKRGEEAFKKKDYVNALSCCTQAGADPNISSWGLTPLARAAIEEETQYMKVLLKAGANPNGVDLAGCTPLEHAALACNLAGVELLFPLTSRIPSILDWSIAGIIDYIHSKKGKEQGELKRKENFQLLKKRGEEAFKKKDYVNALSCYTQALFLFPKDAIVLSNRSLCWACLNDGNNALRDAETCVGLRPEWPKAHYREGAAWTLLKNYSMASEAFSKALKLDPENKEIHKAFKEAVEAEFGIEVSDNIRAINVTFS